MLEIFNKRDQNKIKSLGLTEEVQSIVDNCECGVIDYGYIIDLSKLRKWEIMEVVGNYMDNGGEFPSDWTEIKRIKTFCKVYGIQESELNSWYVLGFNEGGCDIAYTTENPNIIVVLADRRDYYTPTIETTTETNEKGENMDLVKPIEPITGEKLAVFNGLAISTENKGKYHLTKGDEANGFYFDYYGLKVPFNAIFNMNGKTEGILGICFGTARDCPSRAMGLCQLPDTALCYARGGEKRATKKDNENGQKGMDSTLNGALCGYFWDLFTTDSQTRIKLMDYLDYYNIETLRFNLKSDFRHENDILCIFHLAQNGYKLTGYTARDDMSRPLEILGSHENCILNGSNRKYTNRFKATDSLEEFLEAPFRCRGHCSTCRNCYTLRGEEITVLVHGSGSDTQLNNRANREFIASEFERMGIELPSEWYNETKGLTTCINKGLAKFFGKSADFEGFANAKEILNFIQNPLFIGDIGKGWGLTEVVPSIYHGYCPISGRTVAEVEELAVSVGIDLKKVIYYWGE